MRPPADPVFLAFDQAKEVGRTGEYIKGFRRSMAVPTERLRLARSSAHR